VTVVTEGGEAGERSSEMRARRQRSSTASERHETLADTVAWEDKTKSLQGRIPRRTTIVGVTFEA